ncbi:MAG: porin family protein [Acidobacteriota bacterium]|jgi:hypothetical protein
MSRMLWLMSVCAVLMTGTVAQAGDWWLGVRGGPSIPRLSGGGNEISQGYSSIAAPNIGGFAEYSFNDRVALTIEVDYSGQGGERDGLQPITVSPEGLPPMPPGQYLYADFKNKSILNYLEVPVLGKYRWKVSDRWSFQVNGGPYVGYLLNSTQKTRGESQIFLDANRTPLTMGGYELPPVSLDADTNTINDLNRWNVGITAGGGLAYRLEARHVLFLDIRGEYGLRSVQKDTETNGNNHSGALAFLVGYRFNLTHRE